MAIFKRQADSSPNFVSLFSFMKDNPLYFFSSNNIYFAQKDPIEMKSLETFECLGKFCQIPDANFETTTRFLSNFCIPLPFHEKLFLCTFLAQKIYTLLIRSILKGKCFRLPSPHVKFDKFLEPIFKRQLDSSPNFVSLFSFIKGYSSVLFFLKQYILCSSGAH